MLIIFIRLFILYINAHKYFQIAKASIKSTVALAAADTPIYKLIVLQKKKKLSTALA